MTGKKLLLKWSRRIRKNEIGDEAAIGKTLQAAIAETRRTPLPFDDFLQLSCKLWAVAVLQRDPRTPRRAIERGMLIIWDDLVERHVRLAG